MMLSLFRRAKPLLEFRVDGTSVAKILAADAPCEKSLSARVHRGSQIEFVIPERQPIVHRLEQEQGWAHFSVRVSAGLAVQADCVVSEDTRFDPLALKEGRATGVRFQPFFLPGAKANNSELVGRGLFHRGLHFSGIVTPATVSLSCICDECSCSFRLQSFHAGFSNVGYFYSESGRHTLVVDERVAGSPPALGEPDHKTLAELEARLPLAPDNTQFRYRHSLRCPHCGAAYIDFAKFPEQRPGEYYGNTLFDESPLHYRESDA